MRVKLLYLSVNVIFVSFLFACSKNENSTPTPNQISGKVKTVTSANYISEYFYNDDGTLKYYTQRRGLLPNYKFTYTYSNSKIIVNTYDSLNNAKGYSELILNSTLTPKLSIYFGMRVFGPQTFISAPCNFKA